MKRRPYPSTRSGWLEYYIAAYNRRQTDQAATLAMWYQLLYLAFGD